MSKYQRVIGYLPDERPPFWKLLLYAIQQVVVMFPATVLVAILTKFHISTTIFASGLATICFILVTGRKIPLYYGSSFSYLVAITTLMGTNEIAGPIAPDEKIAVAQFGIVMSGLVSIAAGLIVNQFGRKSIEKVLPASVTGPIAMVIGITLMGTAMQDAGGGVLNFSYNPNGNVIINDENVLKASIIVAFITLIATILFSVYLKGVFGQLPLLLGPIIGCIAAFVVGQIMGLNLFRTDIPGLGSSIVSLPHFTLPKPSWAAIFAIMPIALATIPESTAHVYQLDIYVNDLARKKNSKKKYNIADKLGLNLIGDGIGDIVAGAIGGPAGTNYGENISAMAITKVFSVPVLIAAALIAMVISCFTPLIKVLYALPQAVIGGLEIYLFGAIAAQGIAIMIENKVDMFSSRNIAVIATIMVIGIGGQYGFGGNIPVFGLSVPCVAGAAIFGILLNLLLSIGKKKISNTDSDPPVVKTAENA